MLHVGLTGNIASGKSAVAKLFTEFGATVVDADVLARQAVSPGADALKAILHRFGARYIAADGTLDRKALGALVFRDNSARNDLNSIVHPEVARLRRIALRDAEHAGARIVVSDIPLLYETGAQTEFDEIVLVDAPDETRLLRLMTFRHLPEADARAMMSAQWPASEKRPLATFIIENDGTENELRQRTEQVWHKLKALPLSR